MSCSARQEHIYVDTSKLEFLAAGKSGMVYATDDGRILKQYYEQDTGDALVERRAFERLGSHPNIIQCLGTTKDGYSVLERGTSLRLYQHKNRENEDGTKSEDAVSEISFDKKARWIKEAAEGLDHLHRNNVLHADVGCHNMVLVDGHVKLIDFEGCSIDGSEATSCYEWFSYCSAMPELSETPQIQQMSQVSVQTDIFAFGCAVYEIVTGHHPYHELATPENRRPRDLVAARYAANEFPDTTGLPFGTVMYSCWTGEFRSMSEVIAALDRTTVNQSPNLYQNQDSQ